MEIDFTMKKVLEFFKLWSLFLEIAIAQSKHIQLKSTPTFFIYIYLLKINTVHKELLEKLLNKEPWRCGVVVITTKPELRFCAGSNPARGVSQIRDDEDF